MPCERIRYFAAPQYKGLKIELILQQMQRNNIMQFLPEAQDIPKLPRQFLLNVAFTLIQQPFADWVHAICNERHEEMAAKKDLWI